MLVSFLRVVAFGFFTVPVVTTGAFVALEKLLGFIPRVLFASGSEQSGNSEGEDGDLGFHGRVEQYPAW